MKRILLVDDERQIVRMLRASLQSSGYEVESAQNGVEALALFGKRAPDLIITDLAMPEMNGIELTREVRRMAYTPILVLCVRDSDAMKIEALDEGADDYVTKPFNMSELLARVRVQLRRGSRTDPPPTRIEVGDFIVDAGSHTVRVRGEELHLTPKEFDLLLQFVRSPERVLTHKVLLRAIWGPAGESQPEYLRVLVAQLRKKLEPSDSARCIESEPWVGYRFRPGSPTELTSS